MVFTLRRPAEEGEGIHLSQDIQSDLGDPLHVHKLSYHLFHFCLPHEPAKPYLPTRMKKEKKTNALLFLLLLHFTFGQLDYAPYFYDNGPSSTSGNMAFFSISEDTPVGAHIYVLNGTDPEGDSVRYGLTFEMGSTEYFRVESKSGNVTLIQELDREKQDEVAVLVSITDGRNKVVETVRVFVTDANDEAPEFQNPPFTIDVPEDTTPGNSIYRVQALDKDLGSGGSVSYHLQTSSFAKFIIDGNSGILRVKPGETLDYETTPTHFVTVVAKDGGGKYKGKHQVLTSTATITVNVIDAQDMPPSFIGTPYFGYVYEVSVPGSEIFTVYAKDGDQDSPHPIHYSIMNGSDGVFDINSTSGCITLTTYPSLLKNELYEIIVKASEVGPNEQLLDFDVTTMTVRVVDLNNHPPTFYGENGPQSKFEVTMYEHPPAGEILRGFKITVNDSDQGANAKFKLRLVGPSRVLRVVPQTVLNEAQVTIIVEDTSGIDYEKGTTLAFKLLAVEIDTPEHFSATADILINLLDTNDNTPKFTSDFYMARVPENSPGGSSVVSVTAHDPDSGPWGEVKYTIYGSGSDLFAISPSSGLISTRPWTSLDAEVRSKYNFYVKAEDSEGKYSLAEVFVTVLDMNDHPPEFDSELLEKTMIIGAPVRVEAMDDDAESPNNVIEYHIMTADPDNAFDINTDTGEINLKPYIKSMEIVQNITKLKDCKWSLVVQARDRGSPSFSTTAVVNIDITEATPLKGPMAAFLMKSRDNPMKALGMVTVIVSVLVGVTVLISTAMYMRNSKSNRIMPVRRVIKRRQRDQQPWTFKMPLIKFYNPSDKFLIGDPESPQRDGSNPRTKPSPPSAPCLPPPPPSNMRASERPRAVPTISGTLASKGSKKAKSNRRKEGNISSALVSELKMKLEQKIIESNQGYYC
ncbi:cadherin-related family member 1 isoform X2 [Solea solea]|uniref:cadherin-related family member 1 isoform X2 n=1 Tax=Solea solea TaxID=90069 RepID=UPI00272A1447|nr:cadherin-related family member 1 isoform X2 [Solea solea]XP_058476471.1 cadherin-related family member 1 isoform X2 [Solea solea]